MAACSAHQARESWLPACTHGLMSHGSLLCTSGLPACTHGLCLFLLSVCACRRIPACSSTCQACLDRQVMLARTHGLPVLDVCACVCVQTHDSLLDTEKQMAAARADAMETDDDLVRHALKKPAAAAAGVGTAATAADGSSSAPAAEGGADAGGHGGKDHEMVGERNSPPPPAP